MMSYLLLDVENKSQGNIKKELLKYEITINQVRKVRGKSRIIARVITDNRSSLKDFITEHIYPMAGIKEIETIII